MSQFVLLASWGTPGRIGIVQLAASVMLGLLAHLLAATRTARIVVSSVWALVFMLQLTAIRSYGTFIDRQVIESVRASWADVAPVLRVMVPRAAGILLVIALVEFAILSFGKIRISHGGAVILVLAVAASFALAGPRPPDLAVLAGIPGIFVHAEEKQVGEPKIAPLRTTLLEMPSILLVLGESLRAGDYCGHAADPCAVAPKVHALLPTRIAFKEMRSIASYTAISVGALITGRTQLGSQRDLVDAVNVFDLFSATAPMTSDQRLVAYYSAQGEGLFERANMRRLVQRFVTLEDLLGVRVDDEDTVVDRRVDRLMVDRWVNDLRALPVLKFATLHFSGTHAPYFVDAANAPFKPYVRAPSWDKLQELHRAYQNAILAQDEDVARAIQAFIDHVGPRPWMVFFVSDHGEAFGEHKAIHHGQNLYDEQIHVASFVAWGNGGLQAEQIQRLRENADHAATHLDVLPTLLDAAGVYDSLALLPHKSRLEGRSLLRSGRLEKPVPMSNCTASFRCALNNWGMLGPTSAIVAQPWDTTFRCFKLNDTSTPIDDGSCNELRLASRQYFQKLPNGRANEGK